MEITSGDSSKGGSKSEMSQVKDRDLDSQDIKLETWKDSTVKLMCAEISKPFSIGVVPDELRKGNENAYIPKVVSIGPIHKGATRDLQQMEQIKWRCLKSLCYLRDNKAKTFRCMEGIIDIEVEARASYAEKIKLDRYELADILLNDGAFLLQLLCNESFEVIDAEGPLGDIDAVGLGEGLADLILLENQIPFLVLITLAHDIFRRGSDTDDSSFKDKRPIKALVRSFLGRLSLDLNFEFKYGYYPSHFLELVYASLFENESYVSVSLFGNERQHSETSVSTDVESRDVGSRDVNVKLNRCATKLLAAGVTIIRVKKTADTDKQEDVDVKLNPLTGFNFDIEFNNGQLKIPPLHISERADARWLNFIAWEHHQMKGNSFVKPRSDGTYKCKCTMAALLFNGLICCGSDVQLLKDKRIIVDHSKSEMSHHDLVDLFSSIPKGVDRTIIHSRYVTMFRDLNAFSATPYVTRIPIMLWHYLTWIPEVIYSIRRFLRKGYNFAAAIISLLTVIQAVYAVLSYHDSKK